MKLGYVCVWEEFGPTQLWAAAWSAEDALHAGTLARFKLGHPAPDEGLKVIRCTPALVERFDLTGGLGHVSCYGLIMIDRVLVQCTQDEENAFDEAERLAAAMPDVASERKQTNRL